MKLAIAIPTYNGLKHLKILLDSISIQEGFNKDSLVVVVSNVDSNDGTHDFLSSPIKFPFEMIVSNNSQIGDDGKFRRLGPMANYLNMISAIPRDSNWVWTIGDDDTLTSSTSVSKIINLIKNTERDFSYVNVVPKKRSTNTNNAFFGNLHSLCNNFGWNEIFGWVSSRVCKYNALVDSVNEKNRSLALKYSPVPAYDAEIFLYTQLCNKNAIVYDCGLVDSQEEKQSDASLKRWQEVDRGEGYFTSVRLFEDLVREGAIPQTKLMFWRYLNSYWWDKLRLPLLVQVVNNKISMDDALAKLNVISLIGSMLEDKTEKVLFTSMVNKVADQINFLFQSRNVYVGAQNMVIKDIKMTPQPFTNNIIQ